MIEICLVGACGRMGKMIAAALAESTDLHLRGAVESAGHPALGKDIGELAGVQALGVSVSDQPGAALEGCAVAIDFSLPESVGRTAGLCAAKGVALVTGVTGIAQPVSDKLKEAAEKVAVVWAPNMSVGVNLMFKVAAEVAGVLGGDFDVEIVETHHRLKRDAPSGTAKRLAEVIADSLGRKLADVACYGRQGITGERDPAQIAIHAVRSGDVVGEHTVIFGGLGERFEITHRAHSRDTFARGALVAARFASRARPGLYDMQDVLGLKD
ncbi:MAG: 4-hydroxy-tetrahydrodipicolinate reductase [Candidatus Glassbacteria bacterium RIFCSPLOWO2_12_FULL_58_11]|uniref:4-hydroxy-tetrahydrodipicolinate reductase n=1 Tax=Candidatus Glassbacteria bacterium RIFCSPLOWO2_12_FULL_58_11 TaxID=1817867 RepID=A0A1F5Z2M4_9BACT|nr:MAG: 4-hydroxy-tetrahydrodipicolinate reductase [Candidatus Glassbacteria bacterium RIFCSPLOWO2_12_FULL_58_11]